MDRMLYLAMTGAKHTMLAQAANSHNLANIHTAGFKADLLAFRSLPISGPGYPSRVYALAHGPGVDFAPGTINNTGRELDVAINGEGWIAVQAPSGEEAYTRGGDLRISSGGLLVTGAGYPVLGNAGVIAVPPAEKLEIGSDGTISIRPLGEPPTNMVELDRIKLVKPPFAELAKGEDGLLHLHQAGTVVADASVRVSPGALEKSNVNAVDALVNMIELARQFELQVRMMRVAEENDRADTQLLQLA